MTLTNKQKQEIAFFIKHFDVTPDQKEIEEYIKWVTKGIKPENTYDSTRNSNSLFQAKRKLDMSIKMWTKDLQDGLIAYWELENEFNDAFFKKLLVNIRKKLVPHYEYGGQLEFAVLGYLNSKYNKNNLWEK